MNNIICKEAFNKLKQDMEGVRSMHVSWIYDIWERCESAMLKRSNQKPVLEYKVTPMFTHREHITHAEEYKFYHTKRKTTETVKYQQNSLSREELQLLKTVLTDELNKLQGQKGNSKSVIQHHWNYCDKDKEEDNGMNHFHFIAMNTEKDYLRGLCKRYNKLTEIQRKIKKQLT